MAGWSIGPSLTGRDLRIGTAEREQAARLLGEHLAAGRLELAEFEERVTAAYAARTESELRRLFRDLPGTTSPDAPTARARRRVPVRLVVLAVLLALVGFTMAEAAFPPFALIVACWLVMTVRRRYLAFAGGYRGRVGYPGCRR